MQLQDARLCADCDEVHDAQQCPHCASERFSYLTRWVPLPEERVRPRPNTSPRAEALRQLINETPTPAGTRAQRALRNGAFGLAAVGIVGWLWQISGQATRRKAAGEKREDPKRS